MIDLEDKNYCICQKYKNSQNECIDEYTIREKGKSVELKPKNSDEKVIAIIIDQCLIKDNNTKCDALFLFNSNNKKVSFLTELKGAGDIEKAFFQLSYTQKNRVEYKNIITKFQEIDNKKVKVIEKFVIVSNGMLNKIELAKLENRYKVRVVGVLHSEPMKPIPNLRDYI